MWSGFSSYTITIGRAIEFINELWCINDLIINSEGDILCTDIVCNISSFNCDAIDRLCFVIWARLEREISRYSINFEIAVIVNLLQAKYCRFICTCCGIDSLIGTTILLNRIAVSSDVIFGGVVSTVIFKESDWSDVVPPTM